MVENWLISVLLTTFLSMLRLTRFPYTCSFGLGCTPMILGVSGIVSSGFQLRPLPGRLSRRSFNSCLL